MATMHLIEDYTVTIYSGAGEDERRGHPAVVQLLEDGSLRGILVFHPPGSHLRSPSIDGQGAIRMHFDLSQLHMVVELLRTERPVFINYESPHKAYLSTTSEPVGEGDVDHS